MIALVSGRPQVGTVVSGDQRYYMIRPLNDVATLTVSLTTPIGEVDVYMDLVQAPHVIDPTNSSTYE